MNLWTQGNHSLSETLTDNDDLYPVYWNELRNAYNDLGINAKRYGAIEDGITDSTAALNDAMTAAEGKTLIIPPGDYLISDVLTIPDNTTVFAYGAKIFNTSTHQTLLNTNSNIKLFGLELEGAGNATCDADGIGISAAGADSSHYIGSGLIKDCYIHDFGIYGISHTFVKDINIVDTTIESCGSAGYIGFSVTNCNSRNCHVKDISPGSGTDAYGFSFTREANTSDDTTYPFSSDCTVESCLVEDVVIWQGMGTHAGKNITFKNNTIRNCSQGIMIASTTGDAGVGFSAPHGCSAIGNKIYGIGTGAGITVGGIATEHSYGNVISDNELFNCGEIANNLTGGIITSFTKDCVMSGNTNYNPHVHGIDIYDHNYGFSCVGNTCIDPHSATINSPSGIAFRSDYNTGVVSGNSCLLIDSTLDTYVGIYGIKCNYSANSKISIGPNFSSCDNPSYGLLGQNIDFGTIGSSGAKIYAYNATPEGAIVAEIGSICHNNGGGAGTTYYVKESGSGNTGWVGK